MLHKLLNILTSTKLINIIFPALILLLIIGTVEQKQLGLYEATKIYFQSMWIYVYDIPLPGLPAFLLLLVVNLSLNMFSSFKLTRDKMGIFLTHMGVLFFLLGGFGSSFFTQEGFLHLAEGQRNNQVSDYFDKNLVLRNQTKQEMITIPFSTLISGQKVHFPIKDLNIHIQTKCDNCRIEAYTGNISNRHGMAKHMNIIADEPELNAEENMAGLTLKLSGTEIDGIHTIVEYAPVAVRFNIGEQNYALTIERSKRVLPFEIQLLDVEKLTYGNSNKAKDYQSRLKVIDKNAVWETTISMNEPFRYKNYSLFQSSYLVSEAGEQTVLAIVYNPLYLSPYMASLLIILGLLIHVSQKKIRRGNIRNFSFIAGILTLMTTFPAYAEDKFQKYDLETFSKLPIEFDGRVKPIDSFAKHYFKWISGTEEKSVEKLVYILFESNHANFPIIKVAHRPVRIMLKLPAQKGHLYSINTIKTSLAPYIETIQKLNKKTSSDLSRNEKELLEVYEKLIGYERLKASTSLFKSINIPIEKLPRNLQQKLQSIEALSFANTIQFHPEITQYVKDIIKAKGTDLKLYTIEESTMVALSYQLNTIRKLAESALPLNVISDHHQLNLYSFWDIIEFGKGTPANISSYKNWHELFNNYSEPNRWNQVTNNISNNTPFYLPLTIEWWINKLKLFQINIILYGLAVLGMFVFTTSFHKTPLFMAKVMTICAICLHGILIILRIIILERPPVGTLYESILFAGLVLSLTSFLLFQKNKNIFWLYISSGGGLCLQLLAYVNLPIHDQFSSLMAVLNTNFWLTTHVLIITSGYAYCILVSFIAHKLLWYSSEKWEIALKRSTLIALLLVITGTVLGGIWADQSWGRFWGWDPKENGALLIILWLSWLLHGNISRTIPKHIVTAGLAYISVIVAISWFGVNLLNIGLHSYGFTDKMVWGLAGFVTLETMIILGLVIRSKKMDNKSA